MSFDLEKKTIYNLRLDYFAVVNGLKICSQIIQYHVDYNNTKA